MNAVDATSRNQSEEQTEPPGLLTIILDTNPHAWALLANSLPLSTVLANLLVFVNAHLAINPANRIAVLASHSERAEWLYPTPANASSRGPAGEDAGMQNGGSDGDGAVRPPDSANKYRPFAHVEHAVSSNLRHLLASTSPSALQSSPATMIAGALTLALTYIAKQSASRPQATQSSHFNYSDPSSTTAGGNNLNPASDPAHTRPGSLQARILILSVSGDLAHQYIPIMNSIFAAQRLSIPIDICKLAGDTVFLQQAADATGGIYLDCSSPLQQAGWLQYLMLAYLPDQAARDYLITPGGEGEGVDFRAACFCHRRVVDIGFVCSICLSIFCEPLADGTCLTCGSQLQMGNYGRKPAVVPRKKQKKKRALGGGGADTQASGAGTPTPL